MADRVSTGVVELDRELDGGIAPASVVLLRTPPGSQGELLLKELALAQQTLYLSTTRPAEAIGEWIAGESVAADLTIERIGSAFQKADRPAPEPTTSSTGGLEARSEPADEPALSEAIDAITGFQPRRGCILIDPLNPLETCPEPAYVEFLHAVRDHLVATDSVAVLHAVKTATEPRCRWLSLQFADAVWDVRVGRDTIDIEFRLAITKSRSGQLPGEEIKLELSDRVAIDVSRDIA